MCWCEFVVNTFKWELESVLTVHIVVTEATIVAYPMLVDVLVEARFDSVYAIGFVFYSDITTDTTSGADAFRLFQEPRTRLEQEILANQCTDRADIDDIPCKFVIQQLQRYTVVASGDINFIVGAAVN